MSKAYLCPHCRARNRFKVADSKDGVVRCGACNQAFLLPDFSGPADDAELDTAIIDTRGPTGAGGRAESVAGSHVPTLLVHDRPLPRRGSEHPTIVVTERNETAAQEPQKRERNETVRRAAAPTVLSLDASALHPPSPAPTRPVSASPSPAQPVPSGARSGSEAADRRAKANAKTLRPSEVPPAAALVEPGPRPASAQTQPTPPPPQYLERLDEKVPEPAAQKTQPSAQLPGGRRVIVTVAALAAAASVAMAFFLADARSSTRLEDRLLQWSAERGAASAQYIASALRTQMLAGRPDLAHGFVASLPESIQVLRTDGSPAFGDGDWSTYRAALASVCKQRTLQDRLASLPEGQQDLFDRWLGGDDPNVAALGERPCRAAKSLPKHPKEAASELRGRLPQSADASTSWVQGTDHTRTQWVVHPIAGGPRCAICHGAAQTPVGYVVTRTPVSAISAAIGAGHIALVWGSGLATVLVFVIVLVVLVSLGRKSAPL